MSLKRVERGLLEEVTASRIRNNTLIIQNTIYKNEVDELKKQAEKDAITIQRQMKIQKQQDELLIKQNEKTEQLKERNKKLWLELRATRHWVAGLFKHRPNSREVMKKTLDKAFDWNVPEHIKVRVATLITNATEGKDND